MTRKKSFKFLGWILFSGMLLTGCGPTVWYNPPSEPSTVQHVDLNQKSPSFREGYEAGCRTAQGEYSKSSERFNNDNEYHEGWFAGRSACHQQ